jgi:uncharacterized membrane protein (UPF0127 family)
MTKIINKTNNKTIAKDYRLCKSILSKATGLMFSKRKNLIFIFSDERIVALHMIFVFFPIDVLFLDKNKKVVEIKKDFKPWTFYTPKKKAMYVIELCANSDCSSIKIKDIIKF